MSEKKKKVFIGETNNRAEVIEEERNAQSVDAQYAKTLMAEAGRLHMPIGCEYLGSAAIHYYCQNTLTHAHPEFSIICQTNVGKVTEHHADFGWKALRDAFRKAYGRKDPKTRD